MDFMGISGSGTIRQPTEFQNFGEKSFPPNVALVHLSGSEAIRELLQTCPSALLLGPFLSWFPSFLCILKVVYSIR
ncbi:hypothetical protein T08_76 [Trichinella sp. T8]|nr:hypothetical protein T08_76 [Trichinella sp. T8]